MCMLPSVHSLKSNRRTLGLNILKKLFNCVLHISREDIVRDTTGIYPAHALIRLDICSLCRQNIQNRNRTISNKFMSHFTMKELKCKINKKKKKRQRKINKQ